MAKDKKIWEYLSFLDRSQLDSSPPVAPLTPTQRDNLELLIQQAHALWKRGEREAAIVAFEQAAAIDTAYVQNWLDCAKERYLNLLQRASSIETYNRALDTAPTKLRAWSRLQSGPLSQQQRYEEAIASYDRLLQVQPKNHLAWYYRGDALLELTRATEALASYQRGIEVEPRAKGGWLLRVRKLLLAQYTGEAIALCRQVALSLEQRMSPTQSPSAELRQDFSESWQQLGSYLDRLEQYAEAAAAYRQAITYQPDDIASWLARAEALEHLQCSAEALLCYHQVLQIQANNARAIAGSQRLQSQ
jgi:tetratricopeptide (TPR) repeat protein